MDAACAVETCALAVMPPLCEQPEQAEEHLDCIISAGRQVPGTVPLNVPRTPPSSTCPVQPRQR